jgi:hypothetical protein
MPRKVDIQPSSTGAGRSFLKGYQERNLNLYLKVVNAEKEMMQEVNKSSPHSWNYIKDTFKSLSTMARGSVTGPIMNTVTQPMRMLSNQLAFGLEAAFVPINNMMRQTMAQVTRAQRDYLSQYRTGAAIGGMVGGIAGYYWGPVGSMIGAFIGTYAGAGIEAMMPNFEEAGQGGFPGWKPTEEEYQAALSASGRGTPLPADTEGMNRQYTPHGRRLARSQLARREARIIFG